MKKFLRWNLRLSFVIVIVASAGIFALFAQAQESVKISQKEVPEPVLSAFTKAYPKASVKNYLREMREGKTCYELETKDGSTKRDIIYAANGEVMEIEEALKPTELPPLVLAALAATHPHAKIIAAERLTRGTIVQYESTISAGGKKIDLVFSDAGELIIQKAN